MKRLLTSLVLLASLPIACLAWDVPATNRVNWVPHQTVGVLGGIPTITTLFTTLTNIDNTGATDVSAAIASAIASCTPTQYVKLPAGTFKIASQITWANGRRVLRGAGPTQTVLRYTGGNGYGIYMGYDAAPYYAQAILSGYETGSTNITLADASNFTVGAPLNIYQTNRLAWNQNAMHQLTLIRAKSVNTLTFWPPLCYGTTNDNAFAASHIDWIQSNGIEDLRVTFAGSSTGSGIFFDQCLNCWVKNCEVDHFPSSQIMGVASLFCEVRENYIHHASATGGNSGYGIQLYGDTRALGWIGSSGWLIEGNAILYQQAGIMLSISCNRNAIAYNLVLDGIWPVPVQGGDINLNHQGHDMFNLAEGNIANVIQSDGYHGSESHNLIFRNRLGVKHSNPLMGHQRSIDLNRWSYFNWAVGNILGDSALPTSWYDPGATNPPANGYVYAQPVIWKIGYPNMGNNGYDGTVETNFPPVDTAGWEKTVWDTTYRHGNYDYLTGTNEWTDVDHTLVSSYLYDSKPSGYDNWGTLTWPPFGPDVEGLTNRIPAQAMLDQWAGTPASTSRSLRAVTVRAGKVTTP